MNAPPSLVLITVDCLRADHVGFLGYERATTPFLDSLASQSIVMKEAIVAGSPTYYSFPPIMASRYALGLGRDVVGLSPNENTLASTLRECGYVTAAFLAGNPYLTKKFGYAAGFDTFRDFMDSESISRSPSENEQQTDIRSRFNSILSDTCHRNEFLGSAYDELYFQYCQRLANAPKTLEQLRRFPSADILVDEACAWLSGKNDQPTFLWLHFMDPHSPYFPKAEAMSALEEAGDAARASYENSFWNRSDIGTRRLRRHREKVVALYDAGVRWVDAQIARLVESLRASGKWNDSLFVITADHGEEFLEHDGRYHAPLKLTEELIRVPLLLRYPGIDQACTADSPFSLLHLAPTLLDAMNLPGPGSFRGRSYWKRLQNREEWDEAVIVECVSGCTNPFQLASRLAPRILVVREKQYKLVINFAAATEQMYDLRHDQAELHPLAKDEQKPVRARLLRRAAKHLAESSQSRDPEHCLNARLRDLQLELAHS